MSKKDMQEGAKIVGDAAGAKFDQLHTELGNVKEKVDQYSSRQREINEAVVDRTDEHEDRLNALEDNRYYVRMSRHSVDDLKVMEQERLAGWLQKLAGEMKNRGMEPNTNQQAFIANLFKSMGIQDEVMQVDSLEMLATFGDGSIHEIIYKIYLIYFYLYDNSFDGLEKFEDVEQMFKLSPVDKKKIMEILENERIPALGTDGLIGMFDQSRPLNSFTVATHVESYIEISTHPLLSTDMGKKEREVYLKAFALLAPKSRSFTESQRNYLRALAKRLECLECVHEIDQLCLKPQQINVDKWRDALDSDVKKYSWALDAAALLGLNKDSDSNADIESLEGVLKVLKLLEVHEFLSFSIDLVKTKQAQRIWECIRKICKKSNGWKHVLEYRSISLKGAFDDIKNLLSSSNWQLMRISTALISLQWEAAKNAYTLDCFDEDSVFEKMRTSVGHKIIESGRSSNVSSLKKIRDDVIEALSDNSLYKANSVLSIFGVEQIGFDYSELRQREFDLDNSASNENWDSDFEKLFDLLNNTIDEYSNISSLLSDQLELFEAGKFGESILENRRKEKERKEQEAQMALDSKRTVFVLENGEKTTVRISWKKIDNPPFRIDDLRLLAGNDKVWFAKTREAIYRSTDSESWQEVHCSPEVASYDYIKNANGTWYLFDRYRDTVYFSTNDGRSWESTKLPEDPKKDLFFWNERWVLLTEESRSYNYTEKGIIWDSQETSSYNVPKAFLADSLTGPWEHWSDVSRKAEGICLKSDIGIGPNFLIAGFSYDWLYESKKKRPSSEKHISSIALNDGWTHVTCSKEMEEECDGKFFFWNNTGLYLANNSIFVSENGSKWDVVAKDLRGCDGFMIIDDLLFIYPSSFFSSTGYVSSDAKNFIEITLDEVNWRHTFSTNGKEILAISADLTCLMKGKVVKQ
jgi:hypothetical protein